MVDAQLSSAERAPMESHWSKRAHARPGKNNEALHE